MQSIDRFNVVVPVYGEARMLGRLLDSLVAASRPPGFESVYVVENGSDAGARQICEVYGEKLDICYLHMEKSGRNRAMRAAVELIDDGFVLFLDDDVQVCTDYFNLYQQRISEYGRGHFYGGPLSIEYEREPPAWIMDWLPASARGWSPVNEDEPLWAGRGSRPKHELNWFLGSNFGAYVQDIVEAGGISIHYGPGAFERGTENSPTGGEDELQSRLHKRGYTPVFVPDADVCHYVPSSRCDAAWLLHRTFRSHASMSMRQTLGKPLSDKKLKWVIVRLRIRLFFHLFSFLYSYLVFDKEKRFLLRRPYYRLSGRIKGYSLAHQLNQSAELLGKLGGV